MTYKKKYKSSRGSCLGRVEYELINKSTKTYNIELENKM